MRYFVSLIIIGLLVVSSFAQDSDKYLKVERVFISGKSFKMMQDSNKMMAIGGDDVPINRNSSIRDYRTTRQIQPNESQLEDRQHNNYDFERAAKADDNQSILVIFNNLSGKEIKSVAFQILFTENGKKYFERNIKDKPRFNNNSRFSLSERFFSTKNLSKQNVEKEIIIKGIEFTDGTKLKF